MLLFIMLAGTAMGAPDLIQPIDQTRTTYVNSASACDGLLEFSEAAVGFEDFTSELEAPQVCDDLGIVLAATVEQSSFFGPDQIGAAGAATVAGESDTSIAARGNSLVEIVFSIERPMQLRASGEVMVREGTAKGHDALASLATAEGTTIFNHYLVGDGGEEQLVIIDEASVLAPGNYVLSGRAEIFDSGPGSMIPEADALFDVQINFVLYGDVNEDGTVNAEDLLEMLLNWGPCPAPCSADLDDNGVVDAVDLLGLLGNWG